MTIAGLILLCVIVAMAFAFAIAFIFSFELSKGGKVISFIIAGFISLIALGGMLWYFNCTANGQRKIVDQRSNLSNGLDRVVTVYTADGDVIALYEGQIDIEANDGGYIKFDFEGKRYMYYNCFVESIADIK